MQIAPRPLRASTPLRMVSQYGPNTAFIYMALYSPTTLQSPWSTDRKGSEPACRLSEVADDLSPQLKALRALRAQGFWDLRQPNKACLGTIRLLGTIRAYWGPLGAIRDYWGLLGTVGDY